MKDILLLFYLTVIVLSCVTLTLGFLLASRKDTGVTRAFNKLLILLTLLMINGAVNYYIVMISHGFHSVTFNWNFLIFFLLQSLFNYFLMADTAVLLLPGVKKILRTAALVMLVASLILGLLYLAAGKLLLIWAPLSDTAYRLAYYSGLSAKLAYILPIYTGGCLALIIPGLALLILIRRRLISPLYRRASLLLAVFLILYIPLWVYSNFNGEPWSQPLNPITTGAILVLAMNISYLWLLSKSLPRLIRTPQLITAIPGRFCDDCQLSAREREVLELLVKGQSYKEMAASLFVSLSTIKTHLQNIYTKTGTRSRMELLQKLSQYRS